jgi:hypothetical protein
VAHGQVYWHGVIDAHLNRRGEAVQNATRAAPMNFAGLDMLRIAHIGDALEVVRFAPTSRALPPRVVREMVADGVPAAWAVGTFRIGTVEGAPTSIHGILADAFAAAEADDYTPEEAAFSPALLTRVLAARPSAFAGGNPGPVIIRPRGFRAGVVMDGSTPYAAVMPMRM